MCGIAGYVQKRGPIAPEIVEMQLRLLEHRGPDSSGWFVKGRAVVGQTRLAVVDLITGDPPIMNEDASVGVALNGEIYNYRSLRNELSARGHVLRTQGDTEVIAHLGEETDPVKLASQLEGMFAIAVWDDRDEGLVLIRDRLGKKPLYYWMGDGEFVFGSEIKALLAHPKVPGRLAPESIPAYLTLGYVPTPRTFYEGIRSVPPGHVLTLDRDMRVDLIRYWRPRVPGADGVSSLDLTLTEAAGEVRRHLERAVERRLVADVPIGAFLSGGVDSSGVVATMAALSAGPVHTFTIGFEDSDGFDERPYARSVAEHLGTEHVEFVVKPDAVGLVERLVWHYDQPFGDSSAIPTYLLSELTRGYVTVALSGDGGDELFAGYERFAAALALESFHKLPSPIRAGLRTSAQRLPSNLLSGRIGSLQRFLSRAEMPVPNAFLAWISYMPEEQRRRLLLEDSDWATEDYLHYWRATEGADLLDRLLWLNLNTYLVDDLLPKADRMSMAHGLEVRSPLLDQDLVEFALRLPRRTRVGGLSLKRVLKKAVRDLLPNEILSRRKRGFGVPLDRWFRTDLKAYVDTCLGSPDARLRSFVHGDVLDEMLVDHHGGRVNYGHALWALLTLEVFLRRQKW
jgi:asparagine synthase (glutamine-hydrolysing)